MKDKNIAFKVAISGLLIAIATIFGAFSIPIFGAKMSPVQHFINVITAVILGPSYALGNAFITSVLRNILATGSLLAFPGSMIGAVLSGILFKSFNKIEMAVVGEVIGTGIIGALLAYPLAAFVLGREVAMFVYIVPFSLSSFIGSFLAYIILKLTTLKQFLINN